MKAVGKLTLKREVAAPSPSMEGATAVELWIDSGVYHLDEPYSYLVPESLSHLVSVGSFVSVPFNGRELIGVAIGLSSGTSHGGLKAISKVLGQIPLLTPEILTLTKELSLRYASHPFDIIRSAVVDRVVSVEKEFSQYRPSVQNKDRKPRREYFQLPPHRDKSALLAEQIIQRNSDGGVLVIVPELRELQSLAAALSEKSVSFTILDSSQPKSERYRSFLQIRTGLSSIVIGTRSAIFAPLASVDTIMVLNEGSENHYERRSPGWNVRDVALLRSKIENAHLQFFGYSPSSEIARLIDEKWVEYKKVKSRLRCSVYPPINGELLPSRALTLVRKALQQGPVLFVVPLKGYAQAIRCTQCKTISRCECGGAHQLAGVRSAISCNHCGKTVSDWKCNWCHGVRHSLLSRGADRHLHDLAALLPGFSGAIATSEHPLDSSPQKGFVVATPHMAPPAQTGYSAVVILEGDRFISQPDVRSQERVREMYFAHAALLRSEGELILIQEGGESLVTGLLTWNPVPAIHRELEERRELHLPPYVRSAKLTMVTSDTLRLKKALETALAEGRLPESTRLLGPIISAQPSVDETSLIITVEPASGELMVNALHQFLKRRSAAKKSLPSLRINPYSLSR